MTFFTARSQRFGWGTGTGQITPGTMLAPCLLVASLLFAPLARADAPPPPPEPLLSWVRELTDPRYKGRLPGDAGYAAAARWAQDQLRAMGLLPGYSGSFQQRFPTEVNAIHRCRLEVEGAGDLRLGRDYTCRGMTGAGRVTAPVVFVGYGISEPGWDDYAGVDVRGKVVLALKQDPPWTLGDRPWNQRWLTRSKARLAASHGALGLLLVSRVPEGEPPQPPIASQLEGDGPQVRLPAMQVSVPVAEALLGQPLAPLQGRIDTDRRPLSVTGPVPVHLEVDARYQAHAWTSNVVALLPGADPALKSTFLVVGAHLDHVGWQGDVVWPGANDNASGAAAVLAIAREMALEPPPRRSVLFVLFSSEEHRMDGARWFATHSPVPLDRVQAFLNLDCIADGTGILLGGGRSSPVLWDLARSLEAGLQSPVKTVTDSWWGGGADSRPFFEAGIPTLDFVSQKGYTHLHLPTDTADTLNVDLFVSSTRLALALAREVAQGRYAREERAPAR